MHQLEAGLLAESPLSEDVDWASDTSSDLPELGEAVRAVLEELSIETGDPQETTTGPSTVPIRASGVRVKRMELTPQQQAAVDGSVVGASWQGKSRAKTRRQQ